MGDPVGLLLVILEVVEVCYEVAEDREVVG